MRNQFVGDINDYYKYSLLNEMAKCSEVNVCWMLNEDVKGQYSKFVNYPDYDQLAVFLKEFVRDGKRDVRYIENSTLVNVRYYYKQIKDIELNIIKGILFFDPDNGIEVKSSKSGDNKYLFYEDIERFINKVDVLVYQHFPRVLRQEYMEKLTAEIKSRIHCSNVLHYPKTMVDFILIKR